MVSWPSHMTRTDPFKDFQGSPEVIRLAVMMYVRFPPSLRNVEGLPHERGIDISHETVRYWWNRFGLMFVAEIRRKRVQKMWCCSNWRWHLAAVYFSVHSHFNQERHLYSRDNFKLDRAAALAEWRQLALA